jgi:hypothetical protein
MILLRVRCPSLEPRMLRLHHRNVLKTEGHELNQRWRETSTPVGRQVRRTSKVMSPNKIWEEQQFSSVPLPRCFQVIATRQNLPYLNLGPFMNLFSVSSVQEPLEGTRLSVQAKDKIQAETKEWRPDGRCFVSNRW